MVKENDGGCREETLVLQQHTILTLVITLPLALPRARDVGPYEGTRYRNVRTNIPLTRNGTSRIHRKLRVSCHLVVPRPRARITVSTVPAPAIHDTCPFFQYISHTAPFSRRDSSLFPFPFIPPD